MKQSTIDALEASVIDPAVATPFFRVILYGDVGVGKTTWATTGSGKTLLIDSSEGYITIKDTSNMTILGYKGVSQLEAIAEALTEGVWQYDTVVIDELSTIAKLDLETVVAAQAKKGNIREDAVPEQRDYLATQLRIAKALNALMACPCNVVILAHERRVTDKSSGVTMIESDFSPGLKVEINRTLHVIGRISIDSRGARTVQVTPSKTVQAKNRLDLTGSVALSDIINRG